MIYVLLYWTLVCWAASIFLTEEESWSFEKVSYIILSPVSFIIISVKTTAEMVGMGRKKFR